jgi:mRNA interferase YafQ
MMLKPSFTKQFERDLKKSLKRGKNIDRIKSIITKLLNEEKLEASHRDHKLFGSYSNRRECHIEPDWLLIFKVIDDRIIFERTGSHSDLF